MTARAAYAIGEHYLATALCGILVLVMMILTLDLCSDYYSWLTLDGILDSDSVTCLYLVHFDI